MYDLQAPTALGGYQFLIGKTITMAAFGQAAAGVEFTLRLIAYSPSFTPQSTLLAVSSLFSQTTPGLAKCSGVVPVGTQYLVFRLSYNKATGGIGAPIGTFSLSMLFVGKDIDDAEPKHVSDGANTFYGNQTIYGGAWDTAHFVLGTVHMWIDPAGPYLRVKNSAPTSATDGLAVQLASGAPPTVAVSPPVIP